MARKAVKILEKALEMEMVSTTISLKLFVSLSSSTIIGVIARAGTGQRIVPLGFLLDCKSDVIL